MNYICPECLTALSDEEIVGKRCHCGYQFETAAELLSFEQAMDANDQANEYKEKVPYADDLKAIRKDVHFIATAIKVCLITDAIAAIVGLIVWEAMS